VKYYKWIDKNNWGLTDMDLSDSNMNPFATAQRLVFQPPIQFTNYFTNLWNNMSSIYYNPKFQDTRHGLVIATKQLESSSKKNGQQQARWHRFFQHSRPEVVSKNTKIDKNTIRHISKPRNRLLAKFFKDYNGQKSKIHFKLSSHMSHIMKVIQHIDFQVKTFFLKMIIY
jgi:hypothetical protein